MCGTPTTIFYLFKNHSHLLTIHKHPFLGFPSRRDLSLKISLSRRVVDCLRLINNRHPVGIYDGIIFHIVLGYILQL